MPRGSSLARAAEPCRRTAQIEFRLTSEDVNHGFGDLRPRDRLVAQVQVVPGKTQKLVHTFEQPGHYQILCLEFCGFGHALMQGDFHGDA